MAGSIRSLAKCSAERVLVALLVLVGPGEHLAGAQEPLVPYEIVGDSIPVSLTDSKGDAARGRAIVLSRQRGLCLLCHSGPFPEERLQGNLATDLKGVGLRWSTAQLRLRVVDSRKIDADTIMPAYYALDGLDRVAPAYRGKPILTAAEIEDVVAFLATLQD
ncbi:MAG: sulfur oxidation c-type cytochrome SoxX [Proteobacteria bacterium]|nr:MAG: sulfur oxidation c-type cytochrome SoxX [Pseudomonadota bacterium]